MPPLDPESTPLLDPELPPDPDPPLDDDEVASVAPPSLPVFALLLELEQPEPRGDSEQERRPDPH